MSMTKEEFVKLFLETEFDLNTPEKTRLDIMDKFYQIVFAAYQALREEEQEAYKKEHPTKGCDIVFTPEEFLDILKAYKLCYDLMWASGTYTSPEGVEIKDKHNKLYESACMGGVINEEDWSEI